MTEETPGSMGSGPEVADVTPSGAGSAPAASPAEHTAEVPGSQPTGGGYEKQNAETRIRGLANENRRMKQQLEQLMRQGQGGGQPPAQKRGTKAEPQQKDFDTYQEWTDARQDWRLEQKLMERQRASQREGFIKDFRGRQAKHFEAGRQAYPDFDSVVSTIANKLPAHVGLALMESDHAPHIAYHLAKNPGEAAKIAALSPLRGAMQIARMEAMFKQQEGQEAHVTAIPAPLPTVKAKGGVHDTANETMSQYASRRAKEDMDRRKMGL